MSLPLRLTRPHRSLAVLLSALLAALPLVTTAQQAQAPPERPQAPPYYAIRNARIVPVSGPVIEGGTIVIAKGDIAAVGTNVAIPPEAWEIDGKGLTVYPGLIDSLTNLGLPAPPAAGPGGGGAPGGQQQQISRGPEDRPGTTSWENAADQLNPGDKRLEEWRKAGFTTVLTAPDRGIFPGQAALINVAGDRPGDLVLREPAALRINFTPVGGFWSFPGALMGVLSYIKQVYLDADQYTQAWTLYEKNPAGRQRPAYDRALEPIRMARAQKWLVLLPGVWAKEILRAVRTGEDIGANTLLYGAHQGYAVADVLAAKKIPVLVSVKWPEKNKDGDPDADEPLRVLEFRDRAPSTPAAFQKAGVRFAFYSDGIATPRDILKGVKKAIDAGLPADAALRALTLGAAEIFGVADRTGSIQAGKIANLVVTDGDLFEEKTKVKMVFVDGRRFEVREPSRPTGPPTVKLTGKWQLTVSSPQGPQDVTADLTMAEDGALSGTVTGQRGTSSITTGWVSGAKFSFTVSVAAGPRTLEFTYNGTAEGNKMTGTVSAGPVTLDFTGQRPEAQ